MKPVFEIYYVIMYFISKSCRQNEIDIMPVSWAYLMGIALEILPWLFLYVIEHST